MGRKKLFTVHVKDCDLEYFCTGGHGGQNQNRRKMGVRVRHRESGAMGEGREYKSQAQNKKAAFRRMASSTKFNSWARTKAARIQGKPSIEDIVAEQMSPEKIKVEIKDKENRWIDESNP